MICHYFEPPQYLFFASDLPILLYYSHIPVTILAIFVGLFLISNNPKGLANQGIFALTLLFAAWTLINLMAWTNIDSRILLVGWMMYEVVEASLALLTVYLVYVFVYGKPAPAKLKAILLILLLPVLLFAHTNLNVSGFNISDCDAFGFEGSLYHGYVTILSVLALIANTYLLVRGYSRKKTKQERAIVIYFGLGIQLFLFTFFSVIWLAGYLTTIGVFEDSDLEFYGLFGMAIFIVFIGVLMTKFRAFKVGMLAAQALLVSIVVLVGSQITIAESQTAAILGSITLVLTLVSGLLLNSSVKKEIAQKVELQKLTGKLEKANVRLKELDQLKSEFVSIASHQLRSPLTAIRGYASMMAEGSFGKLPQKAQESADRIAESARLMAMSVEDYLNVSRIESGNMKYNYSDFNFRDKLEEITDELRPIALKKGLILLFRTNLQSRGVVHADVGKAVQIAHNLINNSIKYTQKGSVSVFVRDDIGTKKIYVDITDTGVGMNEKTIASIFQKFSRAENANKVNNSGTGLGLFVASKMAEAMGGTITAESEGEGKGSTFTLELPLAM
jgi:signal transduction histidine kinase